MDRASLQCKLEPRDYEKLLVRQTLAQCDVTPHAFLIKHFGMIADCDEIHAGIFKTLRDSFERFVSVGKETVDVQDTAHCETHRAILNISLTSTAMSLSPLS